MHVLRGRESNPSQDRTHTEDLVATAREADEPAVRVWYPPRQVAFGRRDRHAAGYAAARERAAERGYPPVERAVGGRAVALTCGTLAFVRAEPVAADRRRIAPRYDAVMDALAGALATLGVDVEPGEPEHSFCPGTHSLQTDGKVAGLAQRVRRDVAIVGGVLVVRDADAFVTVLRPVYDALDVPFDPASVGQVATGDPADPSPEAVRDAIEAALVGDHELTVRRASET